MYARGVRTFVEVGAGSVLTSMVGRVLGDGPHLAVALDRAGKNGITTLWQGLAQIAVAGHTLDFTALWAEFHLAPDPRAEPKPKMTVSISGTTYGKRYPPPGGAAALPPPNPPRARAEATERTRRNGEVMDSKEHKPNGPSNESSHGTNGASSSPPAGAHATSNGASNGAA